MYVTNYRIIKCRKKKMKYSTCTVLTCVASMVLPPEKALAMAILSRIEISGITITPAPISDITSLKL